MARLISIATGNFTTAGTWGVVDATSLSDSEATNNTVTTSYATSSTFTPGVITVDGIAIKLAVRSASPTGTISVALDLATVTVTNSEVTVNVADLPLCTTGGAIGNDEGGWVLFKFSSSVVLAGATAYGVKIKTSSSSMVQVYVTAGTNWSRMLRTTTTAAPGAADIWHVMGELTGAGTGNSLTVTNDNTATTQWGAGTDNLIAGTVSTRGTLTYGTSASTAYYLKMGGNLIVYAGGTFSMGTSGARLPSSGSGVLEFNPVADGGMGLIVRNLATWNAGGAVVTVKAKLAADAAAAATGLTTDVSTGWKNTNTVVLASTSTTYTQSEAKALTADAVTTALTIAALTNAHSGTGLYVGELMLLDRNVKLRSATSTLMTFVQIGGTAIVAASYVEFIYAGGIVANKQGINIFGTTGSINISFCCVHDCESIGILLENTAQTNTVIDNCTLWKCILNGGAADAQFLVNGTGTWTITNCLVISSASNTAPGWRVVRCSGTFTGNTAVSCGWGMFFTHDITVLSPVGTFSNLTVHSCVGSGIGWTTGFCDMTFSNLTSWRNADMGLYFASGVGTSDGLIIDTASVYANTNANISLGDTGGDNVSGWIVFKNLTVDAGTSSACPIGMRVASQAGTSLDVYVEDSTFGATTTHSTCDIRMGFSTFVGISEVFLKNVLLGSATEVDTITNANHNRLTSVHSRKHDQSATTFKNFYKYGNIASDQTTRHTASGYSWKLTPNTAGRKLILPGPIIRRCFKVAVNANVLVTITAYFQKDGSYNGVAARLVLRGGVLTGIAADVVASMTVASGNWEQLTVTGTPTEAGTLEYYCDCDGTAGNIYVDDMAITQ